MDKQLREYLQKQYPGKIVSNLDLAEFTARISISYYQKVGFSVLDTAEHILSLLHSELRAIWKRSSGGKGGPNA